MTTSSTPAAERLAAFVVGASVPLAARPIAARALLDTLGVTLAGSADPAPRAVQRVVAAEAAAPAAAVIGTPLRTSATLAALANGTAAHALDYDDMCFVSLAHPSAPLVAAALAAGDATGAPASVLLDGYVIGFELEAILGRALNPAHYQRGWHCTSTIGTVGAAACVARILGLDTDETARALAIAASEASGLKENFGTMTKPLHAGLAARNGVAAAQFARAGVTASPAAIDGPQGMLTAMDASQRALDEELAGLGTRWEILETGITIKLYPSCAGTHPTLDAVLELRARHNMLADEVQSATIAVDPITPTVLIYDRPVTGLEGKFSMPFCVAAALVDGRVDLETFEQARLDDPRIRALMERVEMIVDPAIGAGKPPLTQARVEIRRRSGDLLSARADGARGYPGRPAGREELAHKFLSCARRALPADRADALLARLEQIESVRDVRELTSLAAPTPGSAASAARVRAYKP
ncbi:MAG TPA: MmgE/PrpD family protein [Vicinamibacterales bacterium]